MNCLFVGSFNPITTSHELIAKDLLNNKIIDYLYFIPVNSNKNDLVSIEDRIKMIKLIINKKEEVLNIYDFTKDGLFNYDVLNKINNKYNITHIVMGGDLFYKFKTFKNNNIILNNYKLIIIKRDNEIEEYLNKYYKDNNIILITKTYDGSSKLAKENINKDNNYLNKKVLDYIKENKLYN